ncbi:Uridylate kinase [Smittium culicis]|uniref:Uridylate kinase n=1 Tax=Smittium culicis TaxID=133412 RepID=A0A1R1YJE9_9FUNG|nr:Uridylate kinase [Smittium culicis]OMJ27014.1 Uridylate kinase [Smittium culicis]
MLSSRLFSSSLKRLQPSKAAATSSTFLKLGLASTQANAYSSVKFSTKKNYEQEKLKFEKTKHEQQLKAGKKGFLPSVPAMLAFMSLILGGAIAYNASQNFNNEINEKNKAIAQASKDTASAVATTSASAPAPAPASASASAPAHENNPPAPESPTVDYNISPSERFTPEQIAAFPFKEKKVIFVLGGPGSGKGTNSQFLVKDFGFVHLSAGDLLRAERQRDGSKVGELISDYIKNGLIVPYEITISLLRDAIMDNPTAEKFLIDGFPRSLDQAVAFEASITNCQGVLYFECPEKILFDRIMKRSETSGRTDDNAESLKKRFAVFQNESYPVIEDYMKKNSVKTITCLGSFDSVYEQTKHVVTQILNQ